MNVLLVATACCLAPSHDPLMTKLDAEFAALVQNDPEALQLRKAEQLLAQTNESSRWTNYLAATKIMRQTRSKAAVPLLLKYMIPHAHFGSTGSVDTYAETIFLLTGHDIGDPFAAAKSTTDRPAAVRAAVEKLYREWWTAQKGELTTDFAKWTRPQLERYVDRFLQKARVRQDRPAASKQYTAYELYHVIKYRLDASSSSERDWYPAELHARMVPVLLARSGYQEKPTEGTRRTPFSMPFGVVELLAQMRENGEAPQLDEIAQDERQSSAARLICVLSLHMAAEDLPAEVLLSVLKQEKRLEPRLVATMSLMLCRDPELAGPPLIALLDDPHREMRAAAICALHGSKPREALPKLEQMLTSDRLGRYRSFLLDLIASYGGPEAIRISGQFLETALADPRLDDDISDALGALQEASGQRWTAAGAHSREYYREKAAEALVWWRLRQAALARQAAAAEYQHLLKAYRGTEPLPGPLLDAYARLVDTAREPSERALRELCLPESVEITRDERPQAQRAEGRDMNLPFLRANFAKEILDARRTGDHGFLIRTATSAIRYVETSSGVWKIYAYRDKPTQ